MENVSDFPLFKQISGDFNMQIGPRTEEGEHSNVGPTASYFYDLGFSV